MEIKTLKKRNGCTLIQYPSGMYGVEYTDASLGYGMKYTDSKKVAENFFKKVSADSCIALINNKTTKSSKSNKKSFRIVNFK